MNRLTAIVIGLSLVASACMSSGASGVGTATDLVGDPASGGQLPRLRHGNELVMLDSYVRLVGYNPETHATRVLTPCTRYCFLGNWSPDGRWFAYSSDCDPAQTPPCTPKWGLWVERAGAPARRLVAGWPYSWSWAPRGATLASVSGPIRGTSTLTLTNPATGRSKTLARLRRPAARSLVWSPDGSRIALVHGPTVEIVSTRTGATVSIPTAAKKPVRDDLDGLAWSPDGRRIAYYLDFHTWHGGQWRTYVVSAAGSHAPVLIAHGMAPAWSPDGRWIAYEGFGPKPQGFNGLWTVTPNGSLRQLVAARRTIRSGPWAPIIWSPDGSRLVAWSTGRSFVEFHPGQSGHGRRIPMHELARWLQVAGWLQAPSRVYLNQGDPGLIPRTK